MRLIVHSDGGARGNPGPAAYGFIVADEEGRVLIRRGGWLGKTTNNQAEYYGVISALKWISRFCQEPEFFVDGIEIILDSELLVNQLSGKYRIKASQLIPLAARVKELEKKINKPTIYRFVGREKNYQADLIVNHVLDKHS